MKLLLFLALTLPACIIPMEDPDTKIPPYDVNKAPIVSITPRPYETPETSTVIGPPCHCDAVEE